MQANFPCYPAKLTDFFQRQCMQNFCLNNQIKNYYNQNFRGKTSISMEQIRINFYAINGIKCKDNVLLGGLVSSSQSHVFVQGSCLKSCPDSPENTPPATPTAPSSGSQHSGRATSGSLGNGNTGQDSSKSKQRKRKKVGRFCCGGFCLFWCFGFGLTFFLSFLIESGEKNFGFRDFFIIMKKWGGGVSHSSKLKKQSAYRYPQSMTSSRT